MLGYVFLHVITQSPTAMFNARIFMNVILQKMNTKMKDCEDERRCSKCNYWKSDHDGVMGFCTLHKSSAWGDSLPCSEFDHSVIF